MNTQEREQLTQFLQQLTQAQAVRKDSEADMLIRDACSRQTDAAYLLVQRAMILDGALQDSQAQISRLQRELDQMHDQVRAGNDDGGFLDANAWGNSPAARSGLPPQARLSPSSPVPVVAPATAPAASAWGSGMLGSMATTAAGVVAGGFLFQGIEHLLGNHGSNSALTNGLSGNAAMDHAELTATDPPLADSFTSASGSDDNPADDFIADDTVDLV